MRSRSSLMGWRYRYTTTRREMYSSTFQDRRSHLYSCPGACMERPFTMREGVEGSGTLTDPERTTIVEQMNYKGEMEKIDTRVFKNKLTCSCGNVRWVKSSDLFQVKKCKPCTYKERNKKEKNSLLKRIK